jgi:predicted metal-dependent peptidase
VAQSRWPYVSTVLYNLKPVKSEQIQTLAVDDGWRMYYSEEFVLQNEVESLATMLLHEVLHCILSHGPRFRAINQPMELHPNWNIAGDLGINKMLDDAKMSWGDFTPIRFGDFAKFNVSSEMSTEEIFFHIQEHLQNHPEDGVPIQDCGSVIGGVARNYEFSKSDTENSAIKSDQQDVLRDFVAQDILKFAKSDSGIGSVPGELLRWARELLEPKVDWRHELAGVIRNSLATMSGRRDYKYTRPSRRQAAMKVGVSELILPAMRKPVPPPIAVVVDTSGSISDEEIIEFLSEVDGIARAHGISSGIWIVPCDMHVGKIQRVKSRKDVSRLELSGGGGTDLRVGIAAAAQLRPTPKILIVLTDGFTPWPDIMPKVFESAIACLSEKNAAGEVPSWLKTIVISQSNSA